MGVGRVVTQWDYLLQGGLEKHCISPSQAAPCFTRVGVGVGGWCVCPMPDRQATGAWDQLLPGEKSPQAACREATFTAADVFSAGPDQMAVGPQQVCPKETVGPLQPFCPLVDKKEDL